MNSIKLRFGISAVSIAALGAAVWFGVGFAQASAHKRSPSPQSNGAEPAPAFAQGPQVTARAAAAPQNTASPAPVVPATAAITNDEFLNRHYQNQVVADVKPLDTPEQIEQKVRALDPEYAKLLDQNAVAERAAAQRVLPAPPVRPGNDSER